MATWHQDRAPVQLQHPTKYRLVNETPHTMMTVFVFDSVEAALAQQERTGGYIVYPLAR